jgi:hypothetical protein
MHTIGPNGTYIDYFQGVSSSTDGLLNSFGIRVRDGSCLAVVKNGNGQAAACGKEFRIPVQLEMLPSHLSMIVDDHVLNYPASDLIDVLTGRKSFQQALESSTKREADTEPQALRSKYSNKQEST